MKRHLLPNRKCPSPPPPTPPHRSNRRYATLKAVGRETCLATWLPVITFDSRFSCLLLFRSAAATCVGMLSGKKATIWQASFPFSFFLGLRSLRIAFRDSMAVGLSAQLDKYVNMMSVYVCMRFSIGKATTVCRKRCFVMSNFSDKVRSNFWVLLCLYIKCCVKGLISLEDPPKQCLTIYLSI